MQRVINVTAFLDPRYKELPFLSVTEREEVAEQVEDKLIAMYTVSDDDTQQKEPEEAAAGEPAAKQAKIGPVEKLLGNLFHPKKKKKLFHGRSITVKKCEKSFVCTRLRHQLSWILIHSSGGKIERFPTHNEALVQRRFAITATSVSSERLFSSAGMIISARRSILMPDNADKLIFYRKILTNSYTTINVQCM